MFSDHMEWKYKSFKAKKSGKFTYTWKLNNELLSNQWFKEENMREIEKNLWDNLKWNKTYQNFWNIAEGSAWKKFYSLIFLYSFLKSHCNNLTFNHKTLEMKEYNKPNTSRRNIIDYGRNWELKRMKYVNETKLVLWKDQQHWQTWT